MVKKSGESNKNLTGRAPCKHVKNCLGRIGIITPTICPFLEEGEVCPEVHRTQTRKNRCAQAGISRMAEFLAGMQKEDEKTRRRQLGQFLISCGLEYKSKDISRLEGNVLKIKIIPIQRKDLRRHNSQSNGRQKSNLLRYNKNFPRRKAQLSSRKRAIAASP